MMVVHMTVVNSAACVDGAPNPFLDAGAIARAKVVPPFSSVRATASGHAVQYPWFSSFPNEVMVVIFQNLLPNDLKRVSTVQRAWRLPAVESFHRSQGQKITALIRTIRGIYEESGNYVQGAHERLREIERDTLDRLERASSMGRSRFELERFNRVMLSWLQNIFRSKEVASEFSAAMEVLPKPFLFGKYLRVDCDDTSIRFFSPFRRGRFESLLRHSPSVFKKQILKESLLFDELLSLPGAYFPDLLNFFSLRPEENKENWELLTHFVLSNFVAHGELVKAELLLQALHDPEQQQKLRREVFKESGLERLEDIGCDPNGECFKKPKLVCTLLKEDSQRIASMMHPLKSSLKGSIVKMLASQALLLGDVNKALTLASFHPGSRARNHLFFALAKSIGQAGDLEGGFSSFERVKHSLNDSDCEAIQKGLFHGVLFKRSEDDRKAVCFFEAQEDCDLSTEEVSYLNRVLILNKMRLDDRLFFLERIDEYEPDYSMRDALFLQKINDLKTVGAWKLAGVLKTQMIVIKRFLETGARISLEEQNLMATIFWLDSCVDSPQTLNSMDERGRRLLFANASQFFSPYEILKNIERAARKGDMQSAVFRLGYISNVDMRKDLISRVVDHLVAFGYEQQARDFLDHTALEVPLKQEILAQSFLHRGAA